MIVSYAAVKPGDAYHSIHRTELNTNLLCDVQSWSMLTVQDRNDRGKPCMSQKVKRLVGPWARGCGRPSYMLK